MEIFGAIAFRTRCDKSFHMQGWPSFFRLLLIVSCLAVAVFADSWRPPYARTIKSQGGSKEVRIIPKGMGAELLVSEISTGRTNFLWKGETENMPVEVHVSENGSNVVTLNSWGESGYGDHVVAVYSHAGKLANYSLERIAGDSTNNAPTYSTTVRYHQLFPHSTSSRRWDEDAYSFFHPAENPKFFCIWLAWLGRWVALDVNSGKIQGLPAAEMIAINKKASGEARMALSGALGVSVSSFPTPQSRALRFLGFLRDPKDRALIEKSMRSPSFSAGIGARNSDPFIFGSSRTRAVADAVLAGWDNNDEKLRRDAEHNLEAGNNRFNIPVNLGVAEGSIQFAKTVGNTGTLHIRLIPVRNEGSTKDVDANQFFFCDFRNPSVHSGTQLGFNLENLTPGVYRMEIIHDIAPPFATTNVGPYQPSVGDYVSTNAQTFTIQAGETTSDLKFECRTLVK